MAAPVLNEQILLRWTKHVPSNDVGDPLGLNLRVSARLAAQLLHCITSITPRARYYSFFPWCVFDYRRRTEGHKTQIGLVEAIRHRENALTTGCVLHHEGHACDRGGLVGSDQAIKLYDRLRANEIDVARLRLVKNGAFGAYFGSLINLGFFEQTDGASLSDEASNEQIGSIDDLKLTELGTQVAEKYDAMVGSLVAVKNVASASHRCAPHLLARWGERGGLCELTNSDAHDREFLRDIFFNRVVLPQNAQRESSHPFRRKSLLLLLNLVRQLQCIDGQLNEPVFADAVFYNAIFFDDQTLLQLECPASLMDINLRWRMFYFHNFFSVALEALFVCAVAVLKQAGLNGLPLSQLAEEMISPRATRGLAETTGVELSRAFLELTPRDVVAASGMDVPQLNVESSHFLDSQLTVECPLAEWRLDQLLRTQETLLGQSGAALALTLFSVTMARYGQWHDSHYGIWLSRSVEDPQLDLAPSVLQHELNRHIEDWWNTPWDKLAPFILSRWVVRQHVSLGYEKSRDGSSSLLLIDGERVRWLGPESYDRVGVGNPRYDNSVKILQDLCLLSYDGENDRLFLTAAGKTFLDQELAAEVVS